MKPFEPEAISTAESDHEPESMSGFGVRVEQYGRPLDDVTPEPTVAAEDRAWVVESFVCDAGELSANYYYRVYQTSANRSIETSRFGATPGTRDYSAHVDFQIDGVLSDIPLDQIADERGVRIGACVETIDGGSQQDEQIWRLQIGSFNCDLVLCRNSQSSVLVGESKAFRVTHLRSGWAGTNFEAVFFGRIA